jgi:hypothetical protein
MDVDLSEPLDRDGKKSTSTLLVDLALRRYEFGVTEEGQPFAVRPGGHVVRMLRGGQNSLRAELSQLFYRRYGKAAPQQALADALLVLEGKALDGDPSQVHIRVAAGGRGVWLDLGDAAETVVRIDASGWRLVTADVPVLFQRTALTGVMPAPQRGGDLDMLWQQLNVPAADRPLVLGWLVSAIATPGVPHAVLSLFGEQGVAKSTTTKRLVELVDPSPVPLRKPPRDAEAWVTAAQGSWVVGLDNLSVVPDWLSDSLCRAATGEGDVRRALYTDGGLAVFAFRRCVVLNGIDVGALRCDLADRTVRVNLERISKGDRKHETEVNERWRQTHPLILGALFTEVAEVIRTLPFVRLASKPRMADFAHVLAAVDKLHDTNGLGRFDEQAKAMAEDSLSADPFLAAMAAAEVEFTGAAVQLLDELTPTAPARLPQSWPKNARAVTTILTRHAPALRRSGWVVEHSQNSHTKITEWSLIHPEKARKGDPQDPQDMQTAPDLGTQDPQRAGHEPYNPQGPHDLQPAADRQTASDQGKDPQTAHAAGYAGLAGNRYGQSHDGLHATDGRQGPDKPAQKSPAGPTSACAGHWTDCANTNCRMFRACVLATGAHTVATESGHKRDR